MTTDELRDLVDGLSGALTTVQTARDEEADPSLCLRSAHARLEIARNYVESAIEMVEMHYAGRPEKCGTGA